MPTSDELEYLLENLCVELGFCLQGEAYNRLIENPPPDIASYTDAVFRAEGLDPRLADRKLYSQVRTRVEQAFERASSE
jgi:hypothetical protein